MDSIKTLTTGVLGAVTLNVAPTIAESMPTIGEVQEGLGIVSQLIVLIATLVALFRKKKKSKTDNQDE